MKISNSSSNNATKFTYLVIACICIGIILISYKLEILTTKDLTGPILTLLGTFTGALFAFRLNQYKEDQKLHLIRQEALNRTIFSLIRQVNAIKQLKRDFESYDTPFSRAFNLPALKPPDYKSIAFNITELDFLLDTDDPNILFRISIEFERFQQAIESVNLRCNFHINEYQPKLDEIGLNGKITTPEEMERLLGERIYKTLIYSTEDAFGHLVDSNKSLMEMLDELHALAKKIYPKRKFIRIITTD